MSSLHKKVPIFWTWTYISFVNIYLEDILLKKKTAFSQV